MEDAKLKKAISAAVFLKGVLSDLEREIPEAEENTKMADSVALFLKNYIKEKLFEDWKNKE